MPHKVTTILEGYFENTDLDHLLKLLKFGKVRPKPFS